MGSFAWIEIRVLRINGSLVYHKIFMVYIFSRISKKRELRKNTYSIQMSTFTVYKTRLP